MEDDGMSVVIFDSRAPVGTGQAIYVSAVAEELRGAGLDQGIGVFSRESVAGGLPEWTGKDVQAPAPYRLYRATDHWVLDRDGPPNRRVAVRL